MRTYSVINLFVNFFLKWKWRAGSVPRSILHRQLLRLQANLARTDHLLLLRQHQLRVVLHIVMIICMSSLLYFLLLSIPAQQFVLPAAQHILWMPGPNLLKSFGSYPLSRVVSNWSFMRTRLSSALPLWTHHGCQPTFALLVWSRSSHRKGCSDRFPRGGRVYQQIFFSPQERS